VDIFVRATEHCRDRGHVDDGPARSAVARRHPARGLLRAVEWAKCVDLECFREHLRRQVLKSASCADDVDQAGEAAEPCIAFCEQSIDVLRLANICRYGRGPDTDRLTFGDHPSCSLVVATIVYANVETFGG